MGQNSSASSDESEWCCGRSSQKSKKPSRETKKFTDLTIQKEEALKRLKDKSSSTGFFSCKVEKKLGDIWDKISPDKDSLSLEEFEEKLKESCEFRDWIGTLEMTDADLEKQGLTTPVYADEKTTCNCLVQARHAEIDKDVVWDNVLSAIDKNKDKIIDRQEFVRLFSFSVMAQTMFACIDADKDETMTRVELCKALESSDDVCEALVWMFGSEFRKKGSSPATKLTDAPKPSNLKPVLSTVSTSDCFCTNTFVEALFMSKSFYDIENNDDMKEKFDTLPRKEAVKEYEKKYGPVEGITREGFLRALQDVWMSVQRKQNEDTKVSKGEN
eukprot:g141.t1